jgi:hypothetical protein
MRAQGLQHDAAGDRGNQQCGSARFDHGRFSQT